MQNGVTSGVEQHPPSWIRLVVRLDAAGRVIGHLSSGAAASHAARGQLGPALAGPGDGAREQSAPAPQGTPPSGNPRTTTRRARNFALPGALSRLRARLRAEQVKCHSSRCGRTAHTGAGATTIRRSIHSRRSRGRWAEPKDRCRRCQPSVLFRQRRPGAVSSALTAPGGYPRRPVRRPGNIVGALRL